MNVINSTHLTVLILTYNEEDNIVRVLDRLQWVEKIIVIDSYSTDKTIEILKKYKNVEIVYRPFDSFADQSNYGLSLIKSKWVLSLDSDYVLTEGFIEEVYKYIGQDKVSAFFTHFKFLVYGKTLAGNNTTPRAVLFQKDYCSYFNDGHCHRLKINGTTAFFEFPILHDDRKPLSRWLKNQDGYSIKECDKLLKEESSSFISKIRKTKIFAPFFVFFYCLFFKGLIFNGWAGWFYTLQRTMVEILFALRMIENEKLKNKLLQE